MTFFRWLAFCYSGLTKILPEGLENHTWHARACPGGGIQNWLSEASEPFLGEGAAPMAEAVHGHDRTCSRCWRVSTMRSMRCSRTLARWLEEFTELHNIASRSLQDLLERSGKNQLAAR